MEHLIKQKRKDTQNNFTHIMRPYQSNVHAEHKIKHVHAREREKRGAGGGGDPPPYSGEGQTAPPALYMFYFEEGRGKFRGRGREQRSRGKRQRKIDRSNVCFNCGKPGHKIRNCNENKIIGCLICGEVVEKFFAEQRVAPHESSCGCFFRCL